jgi:hypothetical protein
LASVLAVLVGILLTVFLCSGGILRSKTLCQKTLVNGKTSTDSFASGAAGKPMYNPAITVAGNSATIRFKDGTELWIPPQALERSQLLLNIRADFNEQLSGRAFSVDIPPRLIVRWLEYVLSRNRKQVLVDMLQSHEEAVVDLLAVRSCGRAVPHQARASWHSQAAVVARMCSRTGAHA